MNSNSSSHPGKNKTLKVKENSGHYGVRSDLISGMKDKDKGVDLTVCLSPASDPTAGLGESPVYVVKLQHTVL